MTYVAELCTTRNAAWADIAFLDVGTSEAVAEPVYVHVSVHGKPWLRIDVYEPGALAGFQEVIVWNSLIAIGLGSRVHVVDPGDKTVTTVPSDGYFGHFHTAGDTLLMASAERLLCLRPDRSLAWTSEVLGIDGVVVHSADAEAIEGVGEWDPPGGWRPFRISTATGMPVDN